MFSTQVCLKAQGVCIQYRVHTIQPRSITRPFVGAELPFSITTDTKNMDVEKGNEHTAAALHVPVEEGTCKNGMQRLVLLHIRQGLQVLSFPQRRLFGSLRQHYPLPPGCQQYGKFPLSSVHSFDWVGELDSVHRFSQQHPLHWLPRQDPRHLQHRWYLLVERLDTAMCS